MKITRLDTPNKSSRNGYIPQLIVNHVTEGGFAGAVSWLRNSKSQASAHFVVSRQGEITQLVDLKEMAWCNGTGNGEKYNVNRSTVPLVQQLKGNANWYSVSIEHEGYSYKDLRGGLTEPQYQASLWLHQYIRDEVKKIFGNTIPFDRDHVVGHCEIAPKEKPNCPGQNFPWARLMADLRKGSEGVKVRCNGEEFRVDGKIIGGKNYVAIRDLCEKLGYKVDWDNKESVVILCKR